MVNWLEPLDFAKKALLIGEMANLDLAQARIAAEEASLLGRKVLLHYYGQLKQVSEKSFAGLVSEADLESEKVIAAHLKSKFPEIAFLGEENSFVTQDESIPETCWVVDPLDGTTNYIHQFPIYCVSIGLQYQNDLVVGVIDVPQFEKTYSGAKGLGATVNGVPLKVSRQPTLRDSLLATGFFPDNVKAVKRNIQIFSSLVFEARGIRRAGAAAYDLCMVAEGVFDAFWEPNLKPWDAAAGALLVREAGGVTWTYKGADYKLGDNSLMSGNRQICTELAQQISQIKLD